MTTRLLLLAALLARWLQAQSPQIFPALFWGDNQWVSIKLSNQSANPMNVRVDVFKKSGASIPLSGVYKLAPKASMELRTDNQKMPEIGIESWAWARVEPVEPAAEGLVVHTAVEVLRREELITFPIAPQPERDRGGHWGVRSSLASERDAYFLNASADPVRIAICATDDTDFQLCGKKDRVLLRRELAARESIVMHFGKVPKRYLAVEAMPARPAIFGLLRPQRGDKHKFSSESSVQFEGEK